MQQAAGLCCGTWLVLQVVSAGGAPAAALVHNVEVALSVRTEASWWEVLQPLYKQQQHPLYNEHTL
jgi:hypothetical protein